MSMEKAVHGGDVWSHYPVLDFSSNTNPLGPPEGVLKALKENLWRIPHYPDDSCRELREAISRSAEGSIILGNGSTEVIRLFTEAFVKRGDRVVIPSPTYSEYEYQVLLRGAEVRGLPPGEDLTFSADSLVSALEGAEVMFLCDPNNPTGKTLGKGELESVLGAAQEEGVRVLLDEAYIDFASRPCFDRVLEYGNLLVSRSLTKFYTLPGLRLGYGIGQESVVEPMEKLRLPWNVNALAQVAGVQALKEEDFAGRARSLVDREKKFLRSELEKLGLRVIASDTNFFLINLVGRATSPEMKVGLLNEKILVRDCSSFMGLGTDYIRVSVKQREDNLSLIGAIQKVLEGRK